MQDELGWYLTDETTYSGSGREDRGWGRWGWGWSGGGEYTPATNMSCRFTGTGSNSSSKLSWSRSYSPRWILDRVSCGEVLLYRDYQLAQAQAGKWGGGEYSQLQTGAAGWVAASGWAGPEAPWQWWIHDRWWARIISYRGNHPLAGPEAPWQWWVQDRWWARVISYRGNHPLAQGCREVADGMSMSFCGTKQRAWKKSGMAEMFQFS